MLKKTTFFLVVASVLILAAKSVSQPPVMAIEINHYPLTVEKALTPAQQMKGLSQRKSLRENQGMLFVFSREEDDLSFWMKEMLFAIDIIWLNKQCQVVDITKNALPCRNEQNCPLIIPSHPAQYVLETTAGFSEKHKVKVGSQLNICG